MRKSIPGNTLILVLLMISMILMISCDSEQDTKEITVFCGAGLTDLIEDIATEYEKETGNKVILNLASSGFLAKQLIAGADADIYISANEAWMEKVDEEGLVKTEDIVPFAKTDLVLVINKQQQEKLHSLKDLLNYPEMRIAIGDPEHVPAGEYTRQALKSLSLWDNLEDRFIPALDVRAALVYAERGDVEAAIVYRSDTWQSSKTVTAFIIPAKLHEPISFLASKLINSENELTDSFFTFLMASKTKLLAKYGFSER